LLPNSGAQPTSESENTSFSCRAASSLAPLRTGDTKTILIVEGNPVLRKLLQKTLQRGGFSVLAAISAQEAILTEVSFPGQIHLLLTEVMMPDIMGPDLANIMRERRPDMRVMLLSHYPDGRILLLNYGWYFIKKVFLPAVLLSRVNEVLYGEVRDQGTDVFDTRK